MHVAPWLPAAAVGSCGRCTAIARHTPGTVLEHVASHLEPGSSSLPPEHMAWVVFASGTAFFSDPSDDLRSTPRARS